MRRVSITVPTFLVGPFWFFCSVLSFGVVPSHAEAHLGHVVLQAERYIKLDVEPAALRIVVSLTLGPAEMARIMRDADANGDGAVDAAEADRYMETWGDGLAEELTLRIDGEATPVAWGDAYFDPQGPIRNEGGSVEMVARVELAPGNYRAELSDAMPTEALDRTDIVIRAQPGGVVHGCSHGEAEHECDTVVALPPATASENIGLSIDVAGIRSWQFAVGGGIAALVLLLGIVAIRRRDVSAPPD